MKYSVRLRRSQRRDETPLSPLYEGGSGSSGLPPYEEVSPFEGGLRGFFPSEEVSPFPGREGGRGVRYKLNLTA